jgi:hypothetical protein
MSNLKVTGFIKKVLEPQTGEGANGAWAKRTFVVTQGEGDYPNEFVFSLFKSGEHIEYATNKFTYAEGDKVEVEYNVRANEYNDKWYGDNSVWKVNKLEGATSEPAQVEDVEQGLPF